MFDFADIPDARKQPKDDRSSFLDDIPLSCANRDFLCAASPHQCSYTESFEIPAVHLYVLLKCVLAAAPSWSVGIPADWVFPVLRLPPDSPCCSIPFLWHCLLRWHTLQTYGGLFNWRHGLLLYRGHRFRPSITKHWTHLRRQVCSPHNPTRWHFAAYMQSLSCGFALGTIVRFRRSFSDTYCVLVNFLSGFQPKLAWNTALLQLPSYPIMWFGSFSPPADCDRIHIIIFLLQR